MNTAPRMALMATAAALWIAVLPALGVVEDPDRRLLGFALGAALVVLALLHRAPTAVDPGPFLGGIGEPRPRPPSFGLSMLLLGAAFGLRAVTLGRPVAGDDFGFLALWDPAPADAFLARLPLAVTGALTPVAVYLMVRRALTERAALLVGLALAVAPAHIVISQTVGPGAPAGLTGVLATWALAAAAARDRPAAWILYGLLIVLAMALGPWAVALAAGHTATYFLWVLLRRLAGFPAPPVWRFAVTIVLAAAAGAFLVDLPSTAAAATADGLRRAPLALQGTAVTSIAGILALLGLARLVTLRSAAPIWLLVMPGLAAWLLPLAWTSFSGVAVPPWPLILAGGLLAALGLHALLLGLRALGGWLFPGRIRPHVFRHAGLVIAIGLLGLAMVPGLRAHYHRPAAPPAAPPAAAPATR